MDTVTLVENQVEDGEKLLALLTENGFDVLVASWVKTSEEGRWFLYIASDEVDKTRLAAAYRDVYSLLKAIPDSWISMSEIKLIDRHNPITKDLLEISRRYPGCLPTRSRRTQLGGIPTEEIYLYAPTEASFQGFNEIKQRFPSAEVFSLTVDRQGTDAAAFVQSLAQFRGKINETEFEGRAPETVWFWGVQTSSAIPTARLVFVYRPEGWNKLFRAETKSWEEVVRVGTGEKLYQSIDFTPLATLKVFEISVESKS